MKAELKSLHCADVYDLSNFISHEHDNFFIYIEMLIGPKNEEASDIFGINICTPKWLLYNMKEEDIFFARHYLIVKEYDYARIYNYIKKYVDGLTGDTWDEIGLKLSRIGYWEFEDYKE